ncbi:iron uptake transporter deferrochelatase/peroxidase subunit [Actinomyces vulturis]|uniref:iron uptake transporter deferrochelatase/peroxidase subunit n=1 Tax=Actinomyces vulturis TaxID=1857645 RepID=UPI0008328E10|nr:iron uptake transporter deferrochelatase/peroxidase subunit [Actinomyces vulturis]
MSTPPSGCPMHAGHDSSAQSEKSVSHYEASSTPAQEGAVDAGAGGCPVHATSRRKMFAGFGAGALAAGLAGFAGGWAAADRSAPTEPVLSIYPFRGEHQAGITTPAQDNMYTVAFDITTTKRENLEKMLAAWSVAAEQMCAGELVGGQPSANKQLPPKDSGEAWGYPPNGLTITFGVGKGLFVDADGNDRFGLKDKMPAILDEGMPVFAHEQLRERQTNGDLLVQVCSNDAQVCVHAVRNLTRIAFGTAALRWGQIGYGRTSSTSVEQETPRNLFGFKDGTNNIKSQESVDEFNEHVWVQPGDDDNAAWMEGGTYFVARKIKMMAEIWDRLRLIEQEQVFGRDKRYGAPLSMADPTSGKDEFTPMDFEATDDEGELMVPSDSHVAIVAPENNGGRRMLRRGYNYTDGNDSLGQLDAGLFFIAFVRDPRTNFYPILSRMTQEDALDEYLQHQGSALFAVPRGMKEHETMVFADLFTD